MVVPGAMTVPLPVSPAGGAVPEAVEGPGILAAFVAGTAGELAGMPEMVADVLALIAAETVPALWLLALPASALQTVSAFEGLLRIDPAAVAVMLAGGGLILLLVGAPVAVECVSANRNMPRFQ